MSKGVNIINSYFSNELIILDYIDRHKIKPEESTIFIIGLYDGKILNLEYIEKFRRYIIISSNDIICQLIGEQYNQNNRYKKILKFKSERINIIYCVKNCINHL